MRRLSRVRHEFKILYRCQRLQTRCHVPSGPDRAHVWRGAKMAYSATGTLVDRLQTKLEITHWRLLGGWERDATVEEIRLHRQQNIKAYYWNHRPDLVKKLRMRCV